VQGTVADARLKKLEAELIRVQQQDIADLKKKQKQLGEQVTSLDGGLKAAVSGRETIEKTLVRMDARMDRMTTLLHN
jgi:cell division protein FtsB